MRSHPMVLALVLLASIAAACSSPGDGTTDPTNTSPEASGTVAANPTNVPDTGGNPGGDGNPTANPPQTTPAPTDGGVTQPPQPPASPTPVPSSGSGPHPSHQSLLPTHRIISFYGHPSTPTMGVLGSGTMEEVHQRLQEQAAEFTAVDPHTPNKLAFEIIATVAQPNPGEDGTYVLYTGDAWIGEYIDYATRHDMIVILDLQIGHNTIPNEIERVRRWLELPNVHVALDPEFSTAANDIPRPNRVPGSLIGEVSGYDVQVAVEMLNEIVIQHNLPNKILIIHQFEEEMIYNKHAIVPLEGVDIVVDMDGFGTPAVKLAGYEHFVTNELIEYGGLKLFYDQDVPLLDPATMIGLSPPPAVVIYQ